VNNGGVLTLLTLFWDYFGKNGRYDNGLSTDKSTKRDWKDC
jgi:hypothetical protein